MNKAKVGDHIKIVEEDSCEEYHNGDAGVVEEVEDDGVHVEFDHTDKYGTKIRFFVYHSEYEVMKSSNDTFINQHTKPDSLKHSAEEIRQNIFSLRIERERLKASISDIDKQESEMVQLLKDIGFVLHESTVKPTEKTVLYAEDIEEDMTDPDNWKVGDVLEQTYYTFKDRYTKITEIEDGKWFTQDKDGDSSWSTYSGMLANFKFSSRPVNS